MELFKDAEPLDALQLMAMCMMPEYAGPVGRTMFLEHLGPGETASRVFPVVLIGMVEDPDAKEISSATGRKPFIFKCALVECRQEFNMMPVDFPERQMGVTFRFWDKPPAPEALKNALPLGMARPQ